MLASYKKSLYAAFVVVLYLALGLHAHAQSNSASISGTVLDSSGAVVPNATVEIHNPVSHFDRSTTTDGSGRFSFANVPFNPYHLSVTGTGFAPYAQDVEVRSAVPLDIKINLQVAGSSETRYGQSEAGEDLLENDPTVHTDIDRGLFDKIPLESAVIVDEFTGHARVPGNRRRLERPLSWAGGPRGKFVFGRWSADHGSAEQSLLKPDSRRFGRVIGGHSGAPPAEYGGKTSLVIVATTRSGQGVTTPHGSVTASYGSFGSSNLGFDLAYGGQKLGKLYFRQRTEQWTFPRSPRICRHA